MLTPHEDALLAFETSHPTRGDTKTGQIITQLGISGITYYRQLHALVRRQDAIAAWPMTCARVQRLDAMRAELREQRGNLRRVS
jgi:hypothetical protein